MAGTLQQKREWERANQLQREAEARHQNQGSRSRSSSRSDAQSSQNTQAPTIIITHRGYHVRTYPANAATPSNANQTSNHTSAHPPSRATLRPAGLSNQEPQRRVLASSIMSTNTSNHLARAAATSGTTTGAGITSANSNPATTGGVAPAQAPTSATTAVVALAQAPTPAPTAFAAPVQATTNVNPTVAAAPVAGAHAIQHGRLRQCIRCLATRTPCPDQQRNPRTTPCARCVAVGPLAAAQCVAESYPLSFINDKTHRVQLKRWRRYDGAVAGSSGP